MSADIYLAGPMSNLPEFNYPAFNAAAKQLRELGFTVENPAENDGGSTGKPWAWYMRRAIKQLVTCDIVVLLPGWEESRGARLERFIAHELGMPVDTLDGFIEGAGWL